MTREKLEEMAEKYQAKADKDYMAYQETGITRYDTSHQKNEDLADALRMAAAASDEHAAYHHMRVELSNFAWRAKMVNAEQDDEKKRDLAVSLAREIAAYGKLNGLIRGD